MNDWIENTGTVPDGVTADSVIEVEYRGHGVMVWGKNVDDGFPNNDPDFWTISNVSCDIIRWRFV